MNDYTVTFVGVEYTLTTCVSADDEATAQRHAVQHLLQKYGWILDSAHEVTITHEGTWA